MISARPLFLTLSRPLRRLQSVRTRLILWNMGALAALLLILCGLIQYTVRTNLLASIDRELEEFTRPRADMPPPPPMDPGPPPDMGPGPGHPPDGFPPFHDGPGFGFHGFGPGPGHRRQPPGPLQGPRLLDFQGRGLWPVKTDTAWDPRACALAAQGEEPYTTITVDEKPMRVFTRPLRRGGKVLAVVQAAYPLTEVNRVVSGMQQTFLTLLPVALLLAGLGGTWLTDHALRPVRRISQTAARIGAQDLSRRLPVSGGEDEFAALATTFNGMLGRLETAFTQQEALVEQLKRLVEQQRRLTGDASHELRTPLTIIKANTSLALSGSPTEEEYRQSMEDIDRAASLMSHLVQDLLLLARSDGGQLGRNRVTLPIRPVLESAIEGIRKQSCAPIRLLALEETLSICGDPDEITRLFSNLLENAARYTPLEGQITVTAQREGNQVVVSIADTGIGIAPEHLPHLGERFYRVDASRSRPDGGAGLGLAICKSIVEAHAGTMTFQSAVGQGTTVRVTFPAE